MFARFERPERPAEGAPCLWWKVSLSIVIISAAVILADEAYVCHKKTTIQRAPDQYAQALPLPPPVDRRVPPVFYGKVFRSQGRRHVDHEVCLTFDDGPSPTFTPAVLDILRAKRVRATFFVVGRQARRHPDLIYRAYAEGHAIGNHSWNHTRRRWMNLREAAAQVDKTAKLIEEITGVRPTLFRPPFGRVRNYPMTNVARFRYNAIVLWTVDSGDSAHASAQEIVQNCVGHLRGGDIILLHDGVTHREAMLKALPQIIDAAQAQGFRFVTVPEMLREIECSP